VVALPVFIAPVVPTAPGSPPSAQPPSGPPPSSQRQAAVAAVSSKPRVTVDAGPPESARVAPPVLPVAQGLPPRRRVSVAVAIGVVLAVVGIGAAGFAIYLLLNPSLNAKQVAPFALTASTASISRPPAALVPVAPDPEPPNPVNPSPTPAPLPSLVPSPRPHHGHGG
jgi:hypothetical protein